VSCFILHEMLISSLLGVQFITRSMGIQRHKEEWRQISVEADIQCKEARGSDYVWGHVGRVSYFFSCFHSFISAWFYSDHALVLLTLGYFG
jgi:hypothetical protein